MSHILLVDDNEHNLYLARFLLEKHEHQITEAHDGGEAVKMAGEMNYDLIIMDIQMPVLDGIAATQQIQAAGYTLPIIALTARAMSGDREEILAAGCVGYIQKPINPKTFPAQIAEFL